MLPRPSYVCGQTGAVAVSGGASAVVAGGCVLGVGARVRAVHVTIGEAARLAGVVPDNTHLAATRGTTRANER